MQRISSSRLLNDDEVALVGVKHNEFLATVFQNFNFSTNDAKIELKNQFENLDPINFQINWNKEYGNIDNDLIKLKELISDDAFLIITSAIEDLDNIENVDAYKLKLNNLNIIAKNRLSGIDLDATLIALNVFENSSNFWLPTDMGGSGIGYDFVNHFSENFPLSTNRSIRSTIKIALAADGISATIGFLVGAAIIVGTAGTGGAGTPAIIGFLVGVAGESALGSAAAVGLDKYLSAL